MEIRNVLFPTDFSEPSQCALPHALEVARRFDAGITLLHVRSPYADDPNRPEFHFFDDGKYSAYVEQELANACSGIGEGHRVRSALVREVNPAAGILDFVRDDRVDMIVMGTHGRTGLGHFFLGSVAERVVRHAPVPVLTVASRQEDYRSQPGYRKLLVAYDFSNHSREAAVRANELARVYGARLQVLYVIEEEVHPGYYEQWKVSLREEMPEIIGDARKSLAELLGEDGMENVEVFVEVGDGAGRAHREISGFARKQQTDLIVMGTYGLSGVEHMLLGSTTERVIRIAPCPVLTFHGRTSKC